MFRVGSTFLQLKLVLNKGVSTENVSMGTQLPCSSRTACSMMILIPPFRFHVATELSLPQFYQFLHEMEKAKTSLDFFS
jgi:hypothetical protein